MRKLLLLSAVLAVLAGGCSKTDEIRQVAAKYASTDIAAHLKSGGFDVTDVYILSVESIKKESQKTTYGVEVAESNYNAQKQIGKDLPYDKFTQSTSTISDVLNASNNAYLNANADDGFYVAKVQINVSFPYSGGAGDTYLPGSFDTYVIVSKDLKVLN